jgi:arsenite methyltransferase
MSHLAADEVKACCAAAYSSPAARFLLGDSFHPGGAELTARLVDSLGVGPGQAVVDVASGPGTSALQLAERTGCDVVGVDLSADQVAAATRSAIAAGLDRRVRFLPGEAEALPLADGAMDGALCECALCTFPDKPAAARELARVLRRGGRLALSDVTADPERLPAELLTLDGWVACMADARPLEQTAELLADAGFDVERTERHDAALGALLERVAARLGVAGMLALGLDGDGLARARDLVAAADAALGAGLLGYGVVVAVKR